MTDEFADSAAVTPADIAALTRQLGRPARGVVGVPARCACGEPLVAATAPRLPDGTPFPTHYYLSGPAVVRAVSRLEAAGRMAEMNEILAGNAELRESYARAHAAYIADRDSHGEVPEISGFSAGGMPTRVKCLHALVGHSLAAGPGVNPIGDMALAEIADEWRQDPCHCDPVDNSGAWVDSRASGRTDQPDTGEPGE